MYHTLASAKRSFSGVSESQALALTRAANAAAAAAAASASVSVSGRSPTTAAANPGDIATAVKKEHSLSPSSLSHHNSNANVHTSSSTGGDETPIHRRRPSLQGVQDKLSQLQMQHNQQQQQQQQHQLQHQILQSNEEAQSPRFASGVSGGSGVTVECSSNVGDHRRSIDTTSPTTHHHSKAENLERNIISSGASSQNPSLAVTPKLNERSEERVGSITCLPPSALNAVGNMSGGQQQVQPEKLLPTSTTLENRRDFDVSKVNSKSLPLHCVVESVHSLQASLTIDTRNPWKRRPNIETDSYVIVAAATPWSEIVQTALQRLGYSQETASTARGSIIIKNWKPIPLEQISDNPVVPVCDIIGELTSVITLRIVILRTKASPFGEIKDKLLKLLVLQSHAVLRSTGCPLDEVTLSQICRSSYQNTFAFPGGDISEDLRRKFDQWWSNQLSPQAAMTPKMLPFMTAPPAVPNEMDFPVGTAAVAAAAAAAAAAQAGLHAATGAANVPVPNLGGISVASSISASRESLLMNDASHHGTVSGVAGGTATHHSNMMVHPAMHASMHHHHHHPHSQYPNQKTRMRTSFDPEMELPKLQKWFQENPHPSRQQIQSYVVQLNALESRRGRKPLDVNNVVYWFKNARAAQKRAEMRGGLTALGHAAMNGYLSQHGQLGASSANASGAAQQLGSGNMGNLSIPHDYLKSPLSLKSEDIDTMSQHSDDMDEDQSRPCSPQAPLSLTTHERNRNTPADDNDDDDVRSHVQYTASKVKDERGDCRDLLNGSVSLLEQTSRSQSYNGDEAEKLEKHTETNAETTSHNENSNDRCLSRQNDNEANNNSTNSNNNSANSNNNNNSNKNIINSSCNQSNDALLLQPHHNASTTSSSNITIQHTPPKLASPKEEDEDLDMDEDDDDNENDTSQLDEFRSPSPDMSNVMVQRKDLPFPMVPNSMFSQQIMYMSHYMPGFGQAVAAGHPHAHHAAAGMQQSPLMGAGGLNLSSLSNEERRKRNRTFIDPVTEVPKLEQWFAMNTHPSHNLILKYTEDLNTMPYRQKFPRLESKNVQFWFKNRRAKCKRLKMSLYDNSQCSQLSGLNSFVHKYDERD